MLSRPTTPSTEPPSHKQRRFKDRGYPCEWAEGYRPGGFHPVHFGDELKQGRYRVIRKLGEGSYSTVWLAVDSENTKYVALKVMRAKDLASSSRELSIYRLLAEQASSDSYSKHVVMPRDSFEHKGPNGTHLCLVFDPMGATVASMVEKLPCHKSKVEKYQLPYPKLVAKTILKHALRGLAFLHTNGVVHSDVQPGNMLFAITSLDDLSETQLHQDRSKISKPLRRRDGKTDLWGPKYLALVQSLHKHVDLGPDMSIKLSDLGSAFWETDPPDKTFAPVALRAPEQILNEKCSSSIDIWAFGCLIYEFLTGSQLFSVFLTALDTQEEADDDHLLNFIDVLQPLPESMMKQWPRAHKWIGPNGERIQPVEDEKEYFASEQSGTASEKIGTDSESDKEDGSEGYAADEPGMYRIDDTGSDESLASPGVDESGSDRAESDGALESPGGMVFLADDDDDNSTAASFYSQPLEVQFAKRKPEDIDDKEAVVITTLIREILRYEPSERPTAEQLLKHPWFSD